MKKIIHKIWNPKQDEYIEAKNALKKLTEDLQQNINRNSLDPLLLSKFHDRFNRILVSKKVLSEQNQRKLQARITDFVKGFRHYKFEEQPNNMQTPNKSYSPKYYDYGRSHTSNAPHSLRSNSKNGNYQKHSTEPASSTSSHYVVNTYGIWENPHKEEPKSSLENSFGKLNTKNEENVDIEMKPILDCGPNSGASYQSVSYENETETERPRQLDRTRKKNNITPVHTSAIQSNQPSYSQDYRENKQENLADRRQYGESASTRIRNSTQISQQELSYHQRRKKQNQEVQSDDENQKKSADEEKSGVEEPQHPNLRIVYELNDSRTESSHGHRQLSYEKALLEEPRTSRDEGKTRSYTEEENPKINSKEDHFHQETEYSKHIAREAGSLTTERYLANQKTGSPAERDCGRYHQQQYCHHRRAEDSKGSTNIEADLLKNEANVRDKSTNYQHPEIQASEHQHISSIRRKEEISLEESYSHQHNHRGAKDSEDSTNLEAYLVQNEAFVTNFINKDKDRDYRHDQPPTAEHYPHQGYRHPEYQDTRSTRRREDDNYSHQDHYHQTERGEELEYYNHQRNKSYKESEEMSPQRHMKVARNDDCTDTKEEASLENYEERRRNKRREESSLGNYEEQRRNKKREETSLENYEEQRRNKRREENEEMPTEDHYIARAREEGIYSRYEESRKYSGQRQHEVRGRGKLRSAGYQGSNYTNSSMSHKHTEHHGRGRSYGYEKRSPGYAQRLINEHKHQEESAVLADVEIAQEVEEKPLEILDVHQYFRDDFDLKTLDDSVDITTQIETVEKWSRTFEDQVSNFSGARYSLEFFVLDEKLMNLIEHLDKLKCRDDLEATTRKIRVIEYIKNLHLILDSRATDD